MLYLAAVTIVFQANVATKKVDYIESLDQAISKFLSTQQHLLAEIDSRINNADQASISNILASYEDVMYSASQNNLAIPSTLLYVSLDEPLQIIGSFGALSESSLALDDQYYRSNVNNVDKLKRSKIYFRNELPDQLLVNLGYSKIDSTIPIRELKLYVSRQLDAGFFGFDFTDYLDYQVSLDVELYKIALSKYLLLHSILMLSILLVYFAGYNLYRNITNKLSSSRDLCDTLSLNLMQKTKENSTLAVEVSELKAAAELQFYYGILLAKDGNKFQLLDARQLLEDIMILNYQAARDRKVKIIIPESTNDSKLKFYGNQLQIVQILSGILYETILQLDPKSEIQLGIKLSESNNKNKYISFVFEDNGFYDQPQHRDALNSYADIRCMGWHNICDLIDLAEANIEYEHTAYVGNKIIVTIPRRIVNNVVNIEYATSDFEMF